MSIKLADCNPQLRERAIRQMQAEDAAKGLTEIKLVVPVVGKVASRIHQSHEPKLNGLELDWLAVLRVTLPKGTVIHSQAWRVQIANGAWYKVDHCAVVAGRWTAWECKGPKQGKNVARGILALKCAAHQYPEVRWILVWRENGDWKQVDVLP